jgi:Fe-S cluster assembly protein SufD
LLKTADSPASSEAERLRARLTPFDPTLLPPELRSAALERFFSTRSGRERTGRYWRVDIEAIAPDPETIAVSNGTVRIANSSPRIVACSLSAAAASHAQLLARCFGVTGAGETKFGALARAFAQLGAFVYVPADATTAEPVEITYDVPDGASAFPYTVVLAERGARATIVERCEGGAGAFVCGVAEIVTGENADVTYASSQHLGARGRGIFTRRAAPGRDTRIDWACAELGAELDLTDVSTAILQPGIQAGVTALFFPNETQHVDVVTTIDHAIGDSTSETIVKTAAVDAGQARYLGNIRIAPHAQGSDASLRDDALLLSEKAHVDSVPALEIGANDVKAFHGATVGALDAEQIFYMQTRGIERSAAERMIALGFFEPAIARFPTDALREQIRGALAEKLR